MQNPYLKKLGKDYYTKNLTPGITVYGEVCVKIGQEEWRRWDPYRSKLCGALHKGLRTFAFHPNSTILYLGASTGTTVSHLSDITPSGEIFAVEISAVMMKELMKLAEKRENIIPILADARRPEKYEEIGEVDILYQDVAQPDQDAIFIKNAERFLKSNGIAYLCVKSQSVDVVLEPGKVFELVEKRIEQAGLEIKEKIDLEPYDKAHRFLVVRKP